MAADRLRDACRCSAPADHAPGVRLTHRLIGKARPRETELSRAVIILTKSR
jgi:hypothetical protein